VQLWVGSSGAAKVFVNGAVAIADPAHHRARVDQRGATVSLRKAERILTLPGPDGVLRLADERGEGRNLAASDPAAPPAAPRRRAADPRGGGLERRAGAAGTGPPRGAPRWRRPRAPLRQVARRAAAEAAARADLAPDRVEARLVARLSRTTADGGAPTRRGARGARGRGRSCARGGRLDGSAARGAPRPRSRAAPRRARRAGARRGARPRPQARGALTAEAARDFPPSPAVRWQRSQRRLGATRRRPRGSARSRLRFDAAWARGPLAQLLLDRGTSQAPPRSGRVVAARPWDVEGGRCQISRQRAAGGGGGPSGRARMSPDAPDAAPAATARLADGPGRRPRPSAPSSGATRS
jgi:hypothetical protein